MKRLLLIPILLLGAVSFGQESILAPGSYTQNFDGLINAGSGTWADNSSIVNWYAKRTGTGTGIVADPGSGTGGNLYSYGAAASTDRALGSIGSGNAAAGSFAYGVAFQNNSGASVANFQVAYTLEQWRNSAAAAGQSVTFWYKVMSVFSSDLSPGSNTGWTEVTALATTSPITGGTAGALVGNNAPNKQVMPATAISGLTLAAGEYIIFRWLDIDHGGTDHGLAIDDLTISWTGSCNTSSSITTSACTSYTAPSGAIFSTSGVHTDIIPNAAMCDSVITINLTITGGTTSTFSVSQCNQYTVPSGDETYFASGTYMDTIPNHLGCDSVMTINLTIVSGITYYADTDTDGLGDPNNTVTNCTQPGGYVTNSNDCNDNNASIGAATLWYRDLDMDTYGDPMNSQSSCTQPPGYVANNMDCNDANPNQHPGATEIPNNGVDEDCSGADLVPSSLGIYQFNGHACATPVLNASSVAANISFNDYAVAGGQSCALGTGYINYSGWNMTATVADTEYYSFIATPADCYGMNLTQLQFLHRVSNSAGAPSVHIRSSLDNFAADIIVIPFTVTGTDVNETVTLPSQFNTVTTAIEFRFYVTDMAASGATYRNDNVSLVGLMYTLTPQTFYADVDGDTYGDPGNTTSACSVPVGFVLDNTDCDDNDPNEYPGAVWAIDADGDGFKGSTTMVSCTQPANHIPVSSPVDCDDADNMVGAPSVTYYADLDGDMYGDPNSPVLGCAIQVGYSPNNLDCDDNDANINPDAIEICDDIDNNCDGNVDEGLLNVAWYEDADGDGFGNGNSVVNDCAQPNGYVSVAGDCDDTNDQINTSANDPMGDGIDQNCDGVDGYLSVAEDIFFEITASPNPGNTFVMVNVSDNFGFTNAELVSADGRVLNLPFTKVEGGIEIQTSTVVPGMYIIRLTNGYSWTTTRWIKQ